MVTGARRGIGAALLARLAAQGPAIGTARPPLPSSGAEGGSAEWLPLDVAEPADFEPFRTALDGRPLSLVVCNAGIYEDRHENLADGYAPELWERGFATNVTGVFLTVQACLASLQAAAAEGAPARIAVISSQMGSSERAPGGSYIYRASKAAAINLARNLAADLDGLGIAVGVYHPGWVRTAMGGPDAEISEDDAADGLMARFAALNVGTTGQFLTWDGRPHPY